MDARVALPQGTPLDGSYRIVRVIGSGGFGITYLADDLRLETTVAIKEYFPELFGRRDDSQSVRPTSQNHDATFKWGLDSFVREARTLARFRHPAIVQVTRVFEANATAYMVMALEQGQSLEAWLKGLGRAPTQEELDGIVAPLLDALEMMHDQSFLHRDIAPDNIIVRADGTPVLLDFGAARRAVAEQTKVLTGIVKGGYSPQEQYATDGRLQGPWTDIYALGATLYRAVTGRVPEEATMRAIDDRLLPVAKAAYGPYRAGFLSAIQDCLKVPPSERPQSIAEIRPALLGDARPAAPRGGMEPPRRRMGKGQMIAAAALLLLAVIAGGVEYRRQSTEAEALLQQRAEEARRQTEQAIEAQKRAEAEAEAREREARERAEMEVRRRAEQEAQKRAEAEEARRKAESAGPVSLKSLADYEGLWAPVGIDCDVAGNLDDESRSTAAGFGFVGICWKGFELLHQPVDCVASKILKHADAIEFTAVCGVKDYPLHQIRLHLPIDGDGAMTFDETQFDQGEFSLAGKYKRCSRSYACTDWLLQR